MEDKLMDLAINIAVKAHAGQKDKSGEPYILHPLRVMLRGQTAEERIVGALHDVVEDSGWSLDDLRDRGFPEIIVNAVDSITRRKGESYKTFIRRAKINPIGRRVKIADVQDNLRPSDDALTPEGHKRTMKYQEAMAELWNEAAP